MSRYFLALPLPDSVKDFLTAARPPKLPGLKLVRRDLIHVTLHFLGELNRDDLDRLKEAMRNISQHRFHIDFAGVGTFPKSGPPRVIWAGIEENPDLAALHQKIGDVLQEALGFQPEDRPFTPHVTLARVNRPIRRERLQDYWERQQSLRIPAVAIDRFELFESVLTENRLEYREDTAWELSR